MEGTATLNGELVIIVDTCKDEAWVTPGRSDLLQWVKIEELSNIVWVIKG